VIEEVTQLSQHDHHDFTVRKRLTPETHPPGILVYDGRNVYCPAARK
jgi:hypothetical protein